MSNTRKAQPRTAKPKGRLLPMHYVVQPHFGYVTEDGIVEVTGAAVQVPAGDWPMFAATAFSPAELAQLQEQYEASLTEQKGTE